MANMSPGGLGAKVRGTLQAKTVSRASKNAPTQKKLPNKVSFGPKNSTPAGGAGKGRTPGASSFAANAGTAIRPKGGFGGSGKSKTPGHKG